jgi:hypothetical protein
MRSKVWRALALGALFTGITLSVAAAAGATTKAELKAQTLSLANMPTGLSPDDSASRFGNLTSSGCFKAFSALPKRAKPIVRVTVSYEELSLPYFAESLETGAGAAQRYKRFVDVLNGCKQMAYTDSDGTQWSGTLGTIFEGSSSNSYSLHLTAKGFSVGADVVLFRVGEVTGEVFYGDFSPADDTFQAFVTAAVDKVEGEPVPRIPPY